MIYRSDRGGHGSATILGLGLLSAALAMGVVAYSGRLDEGPLRREQRARADCVNPGCPACQAVDDESIDPEHDILAYIESAGWSD